jgi:Family of unknown function (DUF5990)
VSADVSSAIWELEVGVSPTSATVDLRGPQIQGPPGKRFIYLTWGVVDSEGIFTMFRRAKLWLAAVPTDIIGAACTSGLLIGRWVCQTTTAGRCVLPSGHLESTGSQELHDGRQPATRSVRGRAWSRERNVVRRARLSE